MAVKRNEQPHRSEWGPRNTEDTIDGVPVKREPEAATATTQTPVVESVDDEEEG